MSWSLRRMTRFVAQCKYLEQLKQNDDLCSQAYRKGSYLMFSNGKPLLHFGDKSAGLTIKFTNFIDAQTHCGEDLACRSVLLGIDEETDDIPMFASPVTSGIESEIETGTKFADLRTATLGLPSYDASLVARGYSLLTWLETMKFCPSCATKLSRNVAGTMLSCGTCSKANHHYPVIHPVAITRVEDPTGKKVLLVRQPKHPAGMYTCIAGFIESGESVEKAVSREIAEEAGIVVGKVEYFDSQTWPLPQNSLMLACITRAMPGSTTLDIDKQELEDAKWFTKEEVLKSYKTILANPNLFRNNEGNEFIIPPSGTIAHSLLKNWIGL